MAEPQLHITLFSFSGDWRISLLAYPLLPRQTAVPHSECAPLSWLHKDAC